ncbi:hypothetical protein SAMN04487926_10932 [Paraburkholderia steynii]|uniref:Uncharacterized protein n=1 Tax=Paraburkholderia steynii TaxID=1245441 RepID=A0A7Z7FHC5_9BURK|nr:hypothetical protein SAMN04487926_10932 [Paraburkholderia steynii]
MRSRRVFRLVLITGSRGALARLGFGVFARRAGSGVCVFVARVLPFGVFAFSLASAICLLASCAAVWFACVFAGIRALPSWFRRRPCAGRHLLFFAAAKKSRQKKAANTASSSSCLRAPNGSYASHGNHVTHVRCQRSCGAPHPLHAPALHHAVPDSPPPPRWQTMCRLPVPRTPHFGPDSARSTL